MQGRRKPWSLLLTNSCARVSKKDARFKAKGTRKTKTGDRIQGPGERQKDKGGIENTGDRSQSYLGWRSEVGG
jgi:hypothetical protein